MLNAQFHDQLVDLAQSPMVRGRWPAPWRCRLPRRNAFLMGHALKKEGREIVTLSQVHHRAIVDAIAHREPARAESMAREHSRLARTSLEMILRDKHLLVAGPRRLADPFSGPGGTRGGSRGVITGRRRSSSACRASRYFVVPVQVALQPVDLVGRRRDAVELAGVDHQLRVDAEALQRLVHLLAADQRDVEVLLAARGTASAS